MSNYFIKLQDAKDLRRKILESSKASLHILKGYQDLLEVRGKKLTLMNSLRRELKELTVLVNRVDELLPELSKNDVKRLQPLNPEKLPQLPKEQVVKKPKDKMRILSQQKSAEKKVFLGEPEKKIALLPQKPAPKIEIEVGGDAELQKLQQKLSTIDDRLQKL